MTPALLEGLERKSGEEQKNKNNVRPVKSFSFSYPLFKKSESSFLDSF